MNSLVINSVEFCNNTKGYKFLPFRFKQLSSSKVLLTNTGGEFVFLDRRQFEQFVNNKLLAEDSVYKILKSKSFLRDDSATHLEQLASRFWTKKSSLCGFTKLHIFVLTLRCNCSCTYCQASRQDEDVGQHYDMNIETARRSVEIMMQSPAPEITVEFQGGEPLLNFSALREIVKYAKELNKEVNKKLSFVVCTNLSLLTDEILTFLKEEGVLISTSVDGPERLHNWNRCRKIKSATFDVVSKNIKRCQEFLGMHAVSALMTTTRASLEQPEKIVDEYVKLSFRSMFIRALNPYGFAVKTSKSIGYSVEEFVDFYKKTLNYILSLNKKGIVFSEAFTTMLLKKILTPWTVGFVDLQSTTGNGFSVTVYNYDGDVYASDESRMLNEMGDAQFRLGNVFSDSYKDIYFGSAMQLLGSVGVAECLAGCSECPFVPYCGSDPVRHYATQRDAYGNRATSDFCKKYSLIFEHLFELLSQCDQETEQILWSWIRETSLEEIRLEENQ